MQCETITGRHNALMTHLRKLASSRAYREKSGEYLCDGVKLLEEAVKWQAPIQTAVFSDGVEIPELPEGVRLVRVSGELMKSVSPMETPQGALFTVALPKRELPQTLCGRHYLVLDGVQDPGNVGTILRTADAFECDGVLFVNACADDGPRIAWPREPRGNRLWRHLSGNLHSGRPLPGNGSGSPWSKALY